MRRQAATSGKRKDQAKAFSEANQDFGEPLHSGLWKKKDF
jgi:hypothetical protein